MRRSGSPGVFKSRGVPLARWPNTGAAPLLWPAGELSLGVMGRKSAPSAWNSNRPSIKHYLLPNALDVERLAYACWLDVRPTIFCRQ